MDRVVAGALIQHARLLLGHRCKSREWFPGVWDLPGGHVEPGESEADALTRELAEELGVRISRPAVPPIARLRPPYTDNANFELAIWVVTEWAGQVTNCTLEEHDDLRWFGPDEWSSLELAHRDYPSLFAAAMAAANG